MQCPYCGNDVPHGVSSCPSCGAGVPDNARQPYASVASARSAPAQQMTAQGPAKSQIVYVLLGIFLGYLGIHNFYAGYTGKGIAQLLISILSCGAIFWISWIWAVIDICTTNKDARGIPFV